MKTCSVFLFILLPLVAFGAAQLTVSDIRTENGELLLSYRVDGLFDEAGLLVLQRGAESQLVHRIILWKKRGIINPLVKEIVLTMHLSYDPWEKKYCILTGEEKRLTNSLETVRERCTSVRDFTVCRLEELDDNQVYYFSLEISYKPIAGESLTAVGGLLEDGKKNSGKGRLWNVLLNLLGFGDKKLAAKSAEFRKSEGRIVLLTP